MNFYLITDKPDIAGFADRCGVTRIFMDFEVLGKKERQGNLDTVMSQHRWDMIAAVKQSLDRSQLLVRVNPLNADSAREIDRAVAGGADLLMLPMFRRAEEVAQFGRMVAGRLPVIPLAETKAAIDELEQILRLDCVGEVHIGLNDLHLDLKLDFMFEPMANGMIDEIADCCRKSGKPFGIGGIARVGEGLVPGELVLAEHVRLGSTAAILSRTFHNRAETLTDLQTKIELKAEMEKMQKVEVELRSRTPAQIADDHREFQRRVAMVVERKRAARKG